MEKRIKLTERVDGLCGSSKVGDRCFQQMRSRDLIRVRQARQDQRVVSPTDGVVASSAYSGIFGGTRYV
jgi:hypothetical protein